MGWRRERRKRRRRWRRRMKRTAHTHIALGGEEERGRNQHRQGKATVCAASRLKIQSGVDVGDTRSHTQSQSQSHTHSHTAGRAVPLVAKYSKHKQDEIRGDKTRGKERKGEETVWSDSSTHQHS